MALEHDFGAIQTRVRHLETGLDALATQVRTGFDAISQQLQSDRRPQWQAYGVMLTAMVTLAALVWWPISDKQSRFEDALKDFSKSAVSRSEFDLVQERGKEVRAQINTDIKDVEEGLQRQIDEIRKTAGDTFTVRDALMEMKSRQRELEDMILKRAGP